MQIDPSLIYLYSLVSGFFGFAIGRLGDKWGGHLNAPHHWIYGAVLAIPGGYYVHFIEGVLTVAFGLGLFISDLKDFIYMRFWGPDVPHKWKFWSIE